MTNLFSDDKPYTVLPVIEKFGSHHLPTAFQEKLLDIYWLKKDFTEILNINGSHVNDSLTEVSQLLEIIEVQIIRILRNAAKNDAAFQDYWGF